MVVFGSGPARWVGVLLVVATAWPAGDTLAQAGDNVAMGVHQLATQTYQAGDFEKAAELYHTAFKISPQPAYLFNAARSEQRLMKLDVAEKHFRQVLTFPGLDARTRARCDLHLQEIAAVRKVVASARAEASSVTKRGAGDRPLKATPPPTMTAAASGWKTPVGWATVGTGAVLTGVGGWLLGSYLGDQTILDQRQEKLDAEQKVMDISYDEYKREQQALWTRRDLGIGTAGIGLAAVSVGIWMLVAAPEDKAPALASTPRCARLVWHF